MALVRSFDAKFATRSAFSFLPSLFRFPALVWANRFMVQNFLRRDLMSRVNGSVLGLGWMLVRPLCMFALFYLVFGFVLGPRTGTGEPKPEFAIFMFLGILAFSAIVEATTAACSVIVDNGNLVKKVAFPSEVLLVHVALVSQVVYLVAVTVAFVIGWSVGILQPGLGLLAFPLVLLIQLVFVLGLGMLLANLNVFARDTAQLWGLIAQGWMFLSPVFLHPAQIQAVATTDFLKDAVAVIENVNPAWALLQANRLSLGLQDPDIGALWPQLGKASLFALGFLLVGYTTFMSRKHKFADVI
ncbi:MAG: ABC transporter permease [Planctomycetes bacterium]|nr:ABC transporter permease [Planctomycetota bacterium]